MIPLFDPQPQHRTVAHEVNAAIQQVMASGQFVLGPNNRALEREVADYHDVSDAVGVASGTDALHLALRALGVGPGDEVITSPFSFVAAVEAIYCCGARPVFADIHPDTMNLDSAAIPALITERTRAIVMVHIFGLPGDMDSLVSVARAHNLHLVEDCAQAFGARYRDRPVGSFGDLSCFSFFPTKNLGGYGDGGMITSRDPELARQLRLLRNHGSDRRNCHDQLGFNSRLDEVQAAALRVKLRHLEDFNLSRRRIASLYSKGLANVGVQLPRSPENCHHVYGQYTIQVEDRDQVQRELAAQGIASAVYYPQPLYQQGVCQGMDSSPYLPVCEAVTRRCLSLPIFPGMTDAQAQAVIAAVQRVGPLLGQEKCYASVAPAS